MSARFHQPHEYIAVKIDVYPQGDQFVLDCDKCGVFATAESVKEATGVCEMHLIETHGAPYESIERQDH